MKEKRNTVTINYREVLGFYKGKKVLITGNTGFKGSWLTHILLSAGAEVTGYALNPPTEPNLFTIARLGDRKRFLQIYADVRDLQKLQEAFKISTPEIVFHLAAQPIVRDSYKDPAATYSANVMGTVNICEAIRTTVDSLGKPIVRSFLNVTTDKVYRNNEWEWGYRETDFLDGLDPYSNSKSCSELVTHSYRDSFFQTMVGSDGEPVVRVSTARAGNVIGGGDFSTDRIIPDCVRALTSARLAGENEGGILVRNPYSTRPYEHILEPLFAYMMIAKKQYEDIAYASCYNVGPDDVDCISTGDLVTLFADSWNKTCGESRNSLKNPKCSWFHKVEKNAPHEANFLKLDCSKIKAIFGWKPTWHIDKGIKNVIAWMKVWMEGGDVVAEMDREVNAFIEDSEK